MSEWSTITVAIEKRRKGRKVSKDLAAQRSLMSLLRPSAEIMKAKAMLQKFEDKWEVRK